MTGWFKFRERTRKYFVLRVRQMMLITGTTAETVDARLYWKRGTTAKKLQRPLSIKLNEVSDIAHACGCAVHVEVTERQG